MWRVHVLLHLLAAPGPSWPRRRREAPTRDQHRPLAEVQDLVGDAAEQQRGQVAAAVGAHHDQAGLQVLGQVGEDPSDAAVRGAAKLGSRLDPGLLQLGHVPLGELDDLPVGLVVQAGIGLEVGGSRSVTWVTTTSSLVLMASRLASSTAFSEHSWTRRRRARSSGTSGCLLLEVCSSIDPGASATQCRTAHRRQAVRLEPARPHGAMQCPWRRSPRPHPPSAARSAPAVLPVQGTAQRDLLGPRRDAGQPADRHLRPRRQGHPIPADSTIGEVMLAMVDRGIHHLPSAGRDGWSGSSATPICCGGSPPSPARPPPARAGGRPRGAGRLRP